jgi:hypothetical protein
MSEQFNPINHRREEVNQYNANIAMYQAILATLPQEWPPELEQFKNPLKPHEMIDQVAAEQVQQVSELWYADELRHLIRTETLERTKAAAILAALEAAAT